MTLVHHTDSRARAALAAACLMLAACGSRNQYQPPPSPAVTVSKPLAAPVSDYLEATGSVAAFKTVQLVARVDGFLRSVLFQDGGSVKAGELLMVIEPEPYQAKLESSEAQLLNARTEYERQLRLIKENATSQANVDRWQSNRDQAQAAVELAKIQLGYTHILAPFSGRIGRHLVDPGNVVGNNAKLATVEQLDPAYVYFSINERDVLRVRQAARERGQEVQVQRVPAFVGLQTENGYPHRGELDFADPGLDTASGTIQVRAVMPNADRVMLPGMFARVRVPLGPATKRLLVPDRAVSNDQAGSYVLVVDGNRRVRQQRVQSGPVREGMRVILAGLDADSDVVIDGLQNAVPGEEVSATPRPLALPPGLGAAGG
jgi:RND family efflux transporter MFP subunit